MRVAITHTRFQEVGGVERYIYGLCQRLIDAGHEIHYFCHFWNEEPEGITFHKIPYIFKPLRWAKVLAFDRLTRSVADWQSRYDSALQIASLDKLPNRPGRSYPRRAHPRRPKSTKFMKKVAAEKAKKEKENPPPETPK